jgi:gamma-glutamyltranspeptidase/glutathione hydrolase
MYLGKDGKASARGQGSSTWGWRASGVPGTVAGFALAMKTFGSGRISWAEVIEPARRLAADGYLISATAAAALQAPRTVERLGAFPESKRIYLNGGKFWKAGERVLQPELAATLGRLQKFGAREFYEGETAHKISDAMARNAGTIALSDLSAYRAIVRTPLKGQYRGFEIVTMPPPSSGGIALLQMLAMIEPFNVGQLGSASTAKYHLFVEVMRRAFRDRAEYLGDPDFVNVPVAGLLDRSYLAGLMKSFDANRATPSAGLAPGHPAGWEAISALSHAAPPAESHETTQFTVVDREGNAVSNTYTLNGGFGSGVTIPGAGFLMNNEMDDFTVQAGAPNMFGLIQGEANAIAPGKRPLSSMTPTLVVKDGRLQFATGSPGGPTIITTVFEVVTNLIDYRMPVMQAVAAPRLHHQWMPDIANFEHDALSPQSERELESMGHKLSVRTGALGAVQGDAETIVIDPDTHRLLGASDPRKPDAEAVGY